MSGLKSQFFEINDLVLDAQQRSFRGAQTRRLLLAQPPQLRRVCVIPQANVNEHLTKVNLYAKKSIRIKLESQSVLSQCVSQEGDFHVFQVSRSFQNI